MIRGKFVCRASRLLGYLSPQKTHQQILSLLYSTHPGLDHFSTHLHLSLQYKLLSFISWLVPLLLVCPLQSSPHTRTRGRHWHEVRLFRSVQVGFHLVQREHQSANTAQRSALQCLLLTPPALTSYILEPSHLLSSCHPGLLSLPSAHEIFSSFWAIVHKFSTFQECSFLYDLVLKPSRPCSSVTSTEGFPWWFWSMATFPTFLSGFPLTLTNLFYIICLIFWKFFFFFFFLS